MANKLKVMHVLGAKGSGGAELFFVRLMEALKDKCELRCVVRKGSWAQAQLDELGVAYDVAPFGGKFDFRTKGLLKKHIKSFNPDVVQGWMNRACKALPKTSAVNVGRLGGYYALKNYKSCDYLIGNTEELREYLVAKGRAENECFYVPNFAPSVDASYAENREAVRSELNIPVDAKVLFLAGRLHEVKGIDVAIDALSNLPENTHLVVAGSGALEAGLKAQAESLGLQNRVHFLGWVSDLPSKVAVADIWIVPSRQETLGNVVLDAWAYNLPVVASQTQGPTSLIEDGKTGMLVPIEDVEAMTVAVKTLLDNEKLATKMANAGHKFFNKTFSEEVVVKQCLDFYNKVTAGK